MTESPESEPNLSSNKKIADLLKEVAETVRKEKLASEYKDVGEDARVALVCIVAFWLFFSENNVPEVIPSSILGISLARYFAKNLLPTKVDRNQGGSEEVTFPSEEREQFIQEEDSILLEEPPLIFISYSRKDQEYVKKLVNEFEKRGLSIWLDDRIDYGSAWSRVIEENLGKCQAFVLVMTSRSRESHWVTCELNCALEMQKPIFPILLEGKRWLDVAAIQTFNVEEDAVPPERFFERVKTLNRQEKQ